MASCQSIQFIIPVTSAMQADCGTSIDEHVLECFQMVKKVGQGAYGQVWKAKFKQGARICALKKIQNAFGNATDAQKVYREIKYLEKLSHPNIVKMLTYLQPPNSADIYIALQFMQADLSLAIRNGVLKQIHKHYIFCQIVNGVHYLHSAQLIHRDLKPSNILVNQSCEIKICDFGLIRSLVLEQAEKELCLTQKIATRWYRPPQILLCTNSYGKEVDIWSLGCILAQIFLGRPLFQGSSAISQLEKIFEVLGKPSRQDLSFVKSQASKSIVQSMNTTKIKTFSDIFPKQDKLLIDLLQRIFKIVPNQRLSIQEIVTHPFVNKFKGKIQIVKNVETVKIKNQSKKLTVEEYKAMLSSQQKMYPEPKTGKGSQPSTYCESSVTYSLQSNSRQQFFKSLSPLGRFDRQVKLDRQSPERQPKNAKLIVNNLLANLESKLSRIDKKEIFKTMKSNHEQKKQLIKKKEEIQKKYNIFLDNPMHSPLNRIKSPSRLGQDKEKFITYQKNGILRPFSPLNMLNEVPKNEVAHEKHIKANPQRLMSPPKSLQKRIQSMKQMLKMFQSKSRSKSSKNSPAKMPAEKSATECSQAAISKTIGNKQAIRRQNIVPKFILQGRKKFRSESPPEQLKEVRQNLFKTKHRDPNKQENITQNLSSTMHPKSKVYNFKNNVVFPQQRISHNFLKQPNAYMAP